MESHVVNLQDKIQKLIDQYTDDKKRLEQQDAKISQLTDENQQLMEQIQSSSKSSAEQDNKLKALQTEYSSLENRYNELQKMIAGFETIAEGAIKKIDSIFPLIESGD
ncbi:MAG: hypothetical protein KA984_02930 [Candidatus Cloacimonetes bacterium]|nr:hypothetical protein [Candidatus Cloacimonadota bacterium]